MNFLKNIRTALFDEFKAIFRDEGVLLVVVFAAMIYAMIYSSIYGAEVLRDVPIALIDQSQSPSSRRLKMQFDAAPNIYVAYELSDMEQAKRLFIARKIYGIVFLPHDFETRLLNYEQSPVALYADASYFLVYRQVFQQISTLLGIAGAKVEAVRLSLEGTDPSQISGQVQPVACVLHNLFNPQMGYGHFVLPAVFLVIIQQTLLIGLGIVEATRRQRGTRPSTNPFATLLGRSLAYGTIYAVSSSLIFGFLYKLLGLEDQASTGAVILMMTLYICAVIQFGSCTALFFRRREQPLLFLVWCSIPMLMISGISYPKEGIPKALFWLGQLLPSTQGINALIRLRSMGASLRDVAPQLTALCAMIVGYGGLAWWWNRKKARNLS